MATKTGPPSKSVRPNASRARAQERKAAVAVAEGVEQTLNATPPRKPTIAEREAAEVAKQREASARLARALELQQKG